MRWLRRLFRRGKLDKQLDSELRFHVEQQTADNIAAGMNPAEARRRALAQFGGLEFIKEETRDARGTHFVESLLQDVRFALRMLRKSPGFTLVAVLTLALGIGANTAIFSIVDAVLIRPLSFPRADRLVWLAERNPQWGDGEIPASPPTFLDWHRQQHTFSGLSVVSQDRMTLTGSGEPIRLQVADVSASFFSLMGIRPELGRDFLPSDDRIGAPRVVILANQLWRDRFGADPRIIGRIINLDDRGFTVVGVAPLAFDFPSELGWKVSLWTPAMPTFDANSLSERGAHFLPVIGRLKPGQSLAAASADINAIERRIAQNSANYYQGFSASLLPLKQFIVGDVGVALWILLAAAGFVLLIACANVANLVLARSTVRQKEVAIRRALGATGMRLARQLLTESLLMAFAGGATGILIAYGGLRGFLAIAPQTLPRLAEIHISGQVLAFAIFLSAMAAAIFGVVPAWKAARFDPASALRGDLAPLRPTAPVNRGRAAIRMLAVAEIAVTLVLLAGASLMLKSLLRLVSVNPGFSPRNVIAFEFSLDSHRYPQKALQVAFFDGLLRQVRALSGVQLAGLGKDLPMLQSMSSIVSVNGGKSWSSLQAQQATVGPEYFRTMGIPLIKGRPFDADDVPGSEPVAIVNEAFVHRFFPREDPLRQRVRTHFLPLANRLIVGIVGDVHQSGPATSPPPEIYIPFSQAPNATMTLVVRTQTSPESVIPAVKGIVARLDKDQAIDKIVTMESLLSKSTAQPRFYSFLLGIFANLALLLAAIGTYGVIAYSVAQRTHEIGIRMALGARRGDVLRMVIREGMLLASIGIALGVGGALAMTRFLRSLLFEIKPTDPATFAAVAIVLAVVALVACYIPARRAMRVDPMVALRYE
ncbi:MAG TPA: ABC transporter permease [Candidatus Acidoferrales bacterium]|nr:ABC transporter permease [Candidatus Acidoferrales bacterium]